MTPERREYYRRLQANPSNTFEARARTFTPLDPRREDFYKAMLNHESATLAYHAEHLKDYD